MTEPGQPASPGANRAPIEGRISLRELPWCGKLNLRGGPGDAEFMNAAAEVLAMPLPPEVNTTTAGGERLIFGLGPDEWLVHCELGHTETLRQQLESKLARLHHAVTEVTDYYTVLELKGENAAAVLARGCPLDLHERVFRATRCAQSRFGNAGILLHKPGAEALFNLQVRWSFTEYLWDYLASVIDAM